MKAQILTPSTPFFALLLAAAATSPMLYAQNEETAAANVYKVDFTITMREGAATPPGARKFSMLVEAGARGQIRSNTRVAVPSNFQPGTAGGPLVATQYQFTDMGVHITCTLKERGDRVVANLNLGLTDPADATPPVPPSANSENVETVVALAPGRPLTVLAWDAAGGKRRYEVEITATKLR